MPIAPARMGASASLVKAARSEGNDKFVRGDFAGAAKLYRDALKGGGSSTHLLHANLAACFLARGLIASAMAETDATISDAPCWPKGHYRRGAALAALELWPEAMRSYAVRNEPPVNPSHFCYCFI